MASQYSIREATHADLEAIVGFTLREADEAEGVELSDDMVRRGVRGGLEDPVLARYWVAETPEGDVIAATSVVTEWSNFNGGHYWWIQSLYIVPECRGRGLVEMLLGHIAAAARAAGAVDLRLYAHQSNERAMRTYRRCGFTPAPYTIMSRQLVPDGSS
jgi:ribosomal protein S18 acetylase RimI-like enzyme